MLSARDDHPGAAYRLAPVWIGALGRVQAPSPFRERGELGASFYKDLDPSVNGYHVTFQQVDHVIAALPTGVADIEDRSDLREAEPGGLGITNEAETVDGLLTVIAIAVRGTIGLGQQSYPLVVADSLRGHSGALGDLSDLHKREDTTTL
jgi:hypothetical protein